MCMYVYEENSIFTINSKRNLLITKDRNYIALFTVLTLLKNILFKRIALAVSVNAIRLVLCIVDLVHPFRDCTFSVQFFVR